MADLNKPQEAISKKKRKLQEPPAGDDAVEEPVKKKKKKKDKQPQAEADEAEPPLDGGETEEQVPKKKKKKKAQEAAAEEASQADTKNAELVTDPEEIAKALGGGAAPTSFDGLELTDGTRKGVEHMGFTKMMEIQARCIPLLLSGKDVVGQAKTGAGKTLAFVLPCIELMVRTKFMVRNGTACIMIAPVRELCLQIHGVVAQMLKYHASHTHGCCFGGNNPKHEIEKLNKGLNVLVATPGRLLDHLRNCRTFVFKNLLALVIDEADRILQQGFEEEMRDIIDILPRTRQTMLFSATQTTKVQDLIRLSFQNPPIYVGVHDTAEHSTADGLTQGYVVISAEKRFLLLFTFLRKYKGKKIMVFFSACKEVQFFSELLNYIDVPVWDLHGKQKQQKRTNTFLQFTNAPSGVLLATDVAARGLDIPNVDWIVQYDPPDQPEEYVHRVGRTARAGRVGNALLFLMPEELGFLKYLKSYKIPLNEYEYPESRLPALVANKLKTLIETNYYLYKSARDAYRSYMLSYHSHSMKNIFDVSKLDVMKIAMSFGLDQPPTVNFAICDTHRKKDKGREFGSGWSTLRDRGRDRTHTTDGGRSGVQWTR